ncbi:hypothetical protein M407DRAFT_84650, partial [Tulasnella calospora MUT 4182]
FYAIKTRRSRDYIRALPFRKKRPFSTLFPNANALAIDFLTQTLMFDPEKRITVEKALAHPYVEAYVYVRLPLSSFSYHFQASPADFTNALSSARSR